MKPEATDTQLFGTHDAPPYRRQRGDRDIRAIPRITRSALTMLCASTAIAVR